jgi:hypothetical protein
MVDADDLGNGARHGGSSWECSSVYHNDDIGLFQTTARGTKSGADIEDAGQWRWQRRAVRRRRTGRNHDELRNTKDRIA